jgi:tripartite-type tricarboxylate transporter receptor subunit TctC
MPDLLSNRVQLGLNAPSVVLPYIEKGQLRALAVVAPKRNPKLPNVPTVAEVGLKPMEACSNWLGLHAPKGTPDAIVQKIHKAIAETMQTDAVRKGMEALNIYPIVTTPAQFSARIARDYELFGKVAKAANVQSE